MNFRRRSVGVPAESPSLPCIAGLQAKGRLCCHQEWSASCLAVLPLSAAADGCRFRPLDSAPPLARLATGLSLHLGARRVIDRMRSTYWPPKVPSLAPALVAAFAHAKLDPTLKRMMRRLEADDLAALRGRGSGEFDPLDATPQHQPETDLISRPRMSQPRQDGTLVRLLLAGSWSQTVVRSGLC